MKDPGADHLFSLIEEAYSLSLLGRFGESLRLLDGVADARGRLCRARVALASGSDEVHGTATVELEHLRLEGGALAWRAAIDLARLARSEGRDIDAAAFLGQAIESFRGAGGDAGSALGSAGKALASVLSAEVAAQGEGDPGATAADLGESALLLRLVEMGKRLASETDPEQVLRIVLHEAIEITGTERGFVVLVAGDDIDCALAENLDRTEIKTPAFEVSRSLLRRVLKQGEPLVLALSDSRVENPYSRLIESGVRSVACVPIVHDGVTLGVLYLDGRRPSRAPAGPVERVLHLLATLAGAALDNARAHQATGLALEAAHERLRRHRNEAERRAGYGELIGAADAMQEVYRKLDLVTPTEMPVLIEGETGTGKELAARLIHSRGPRARREFIATNCAGIAESLLESELFGHERGSFTGAERSRQGLFELAHGGTLFLDEIGDMSLRMQAEVLRVLQSGEVRRVGGRDTFHVDVRVIAATHRNLEELQRRGEFRQDLYYRVNVLTLSLPALRERAGDVPLLLTAMLQRATNGRRSPPEISAPAMRRLAAYAWPGNVRELENIARRLSVLGVDLIEERHLPPEILRSLPAARRAGTLRRAEEDAVQRAMTAAGGNKAEAARILGVDRKTLYAKIRRLRAPEAERPG